MSLQIIAFCYIFMMLATPITIYLLFAFRKSKEVKIEEQKRNIPTPTLHHWADAYEPSDDYWSNSYEDMCNRQNAKEAGCTVEELCFCGYEAKDPDFGDGTRCTKCFLRYKGYIAMRKIISSLEGADPKINWDEYDEEECTFTDGSCPECEAWSCVGILCDNCFYPKESDEDGEEEEDEGLDEMYLLQEKLNKNKKELKKFKKRKPKYRKKINKELSFRELHIINTFG